MTAQDSKASTPAPTEAEQRTAAPAANFNKKANEIAAAAGNGVVKIVGAAKDGATTLAQDAADAVSDPSAAADKLKKKGKGFWESLDFSSILGAVGGLAGAWFLGNIFGDIFGGGILSTLLMVGLAFLLVPAGMDIANGLFGKNGKKSDVPLENQPQRFTTPQVQQLLEKADAPGMKHDVLQVIKVPGQKLTLAPVPEGATIPANMLVSRAVIEKQMNDCKAANVSCDFMLVPVDKEGYNFGTVPPEEPKQARRTQDKSESAQRTPRAQARGKRQGDVTPAPGVEAAEPTPHLIPRRWIRHPEQRPRHVSDAEYNDQPKPSVQQALSQDAMNAMMEHANTIRQASTAVDGQRAADPQSLLPRNSVRDELGFIRT